MEVEQIGNETDFEVVKLKIPVFVISLKSRIVLFGLYG